MTMMETSTTGVRVSLVPRCLCWPRLDKLRGEQERERERESSHTERARQEGRQGGRPAPVAAAPPEERREGKSNADSVNVDTRNFDFKPKFSSLSLFFFYSFRE